MQRIVFTGGLLPVQGIPPLKKKTSVTWFAPQRELFYLPSTGDSEEKFSALGI